MTKEVKLTLTQVAERNIKEDSDRCFVDAIQSKIRQMYNSKKRIDDNKEYIKQQEDEIKGYEIDIKDLEKRHKSGEILRDEGVTGSFVGVDFSCNGHTICV